FYRQRQRRLAGWQCFGQKRCKRYVAIAYGDKAMQRLRVVFQVQNVGTGKQARDLIGGRHMASSVSVGNVWESLKPWVLVPRDEHVELRKIDDIAHVLVFDVQLHVEFLG